MKQKHLDYIITLFGILLTVTGLCLAIFCQNPQGMMKSLPFLCIGIGCGLFGKGMSTILTYNILQKHPELQKMKAIEVKDERNIAIMNCAKAKAFDAMTVLFSAVIIALGLMNVEVPAILLLIAAYLFVQGYSLYCHAKLNKEM